MEESSVRLEQLSISETLDEDTNKLEDEEEKGCFTLASWNLDNLPVEIFLHICSYLDAKFVICSLRLVCRSFNQIISDDAIWKSRIAKTINGRYPPLPDNIETFNWKLACMEIEEQQNLWSNPDRNLKYVQNRSSHYATVDAIHLLPNSSLCVSGSRDRSIILWDLAQVLEEPDAHDIKHLKVMENAHQGWVWSFDSCNDILYSGSWDTDLKKWKLCDTLRMENAFKCSAAILAVVCTENLVVCGIYGRKVLLFDPRASADPVHSYSAHRQAVLSLALCDNLIFSASEDQTLAAWDQRAGKLLKKDLRVGKETFPLSMSYKNRLLYVGDTKGQLHLVDPFREDISIVDDYNVGHSGKLTGVQHGYGSIITCSTDGTLKVLTPTGSPQTIVELKSNGGEVTQIHYQNNILAAACTENSVEMWIPSPDYLSCA